MSDPHDEPEVPDTLPEALIQRIDSLELPELKAVLSYVERRIDALRVPIEEEIEATAAGEVLQIENYGVYALVRKHPPNPDGPGVNTDIVSLYHVHRESQPDGAESLHWAYLGDVHNSEQIRCDSCGARLDKNASVCPHCGNKHISQSETGE
ncbi:zinc ribbon domain-containing protein [Halobellus sp. H-GB7]|uniref:zinc ribbon domain-containing protein n=1 Tax=Halobellus sp. H-GB7 TaxID=3069756 RepID=UPI0027B046D2|nr:zinc ribbon domain-containing protein [Halobellus sp. H-GB7]MDQ2055553.1 zinc ribbon domain-containing protein [Halobellus sp. H-GB7]